MTDLHEVAGLTFAGYDEDGQRMWVGRREAWQRYENLEDGIVSDGEGNMYAVVPNGSDDYDYEPIG